MNEMYSHDHDIESMSILIVDDNRENLRLLASILSGHGYTIRIATDGEQALKSVDAKPPDLILLDVMMPTMDGYAVCQALKQNEDTRDIPVIFVSALHEVLDKVRAFTVGAVDYITKPFQAEEVLARVATHAALQRMKRQLMNQNQQLQQEIADRIRTEEALRMSEERFRTMADFTYDWEYWLAPDGSYVYISPACERISGYSVNDFLTIPNLLQDIIHPDDQQEFQDHLKTRQSDDGVRFLEFRIITRDGQERWINHTCQPVYDHHGRWMGSRASNRDVTEQKVAEEQVRKLYRAVEQSPTTIVITNTDGIIEYVNPHFTQLTGYSAEEALGQNPRVLKSGEMDQVVYEELWSTISSGREWHGELYNRRKDGTLFWELASISPVLDHHGHITHYVAVKEDITERKAIEAALREANERLEESIGELERRNLEMQLLNRMNSFLQRSESPAEAIEISLPFIQQLFVDQSGAIYLFNEDQNQLEILTSWGKSPPRQEVLDPDCCWAFAGGRMNLVEDPESDVRCDHIEEDAKYYPCICVQLLTKGRPLGLLHVRNGPTGDGVREHWQRLVSMVADQIALAFSNLHLQAILQQQAIRDQLTGLFNRCYLEETLERELRCAIRHGYSVGFVALDIDHFSSYNTSYGREEGDALLKEVGRLIQSHIRGIDIACRLYDDVFLVMLPGSPLTATIERATMFRETIREQTSTNPMLLEPVTVSVGVTSFPEHACSGTTILEMVARALRQAQQQGSDHMVVAECDESYVSP